MVKGKILGCIGKGLRWVLEPFIRLTSISL